jgi:hypothetical protein
MKCPYCDASSNKAGVYRPPAEILCLSCGKRYEAKEMKQVHLIGDSHTTMYAELKEIKSYHLGAATAYGLISDHSITQSFQQTHDLLKILDQERDLIVFAFGEIDCRILIYFKHMQSSRGLMELIGVVLDRYFSAISLVQEKGFDVAVHGIIPAVRQKTPYYLKYYGADNVRAAISFHFNEELRELCVEKGIKYFDTYKLPYMLSGEVLMIPAEVMKPDMAHVDPSKVPIAEDFKKWLEESELL